MTNLTDKKQVSEFYNLCKKYGINNVWDTKEALDAIKFLEEYDDKILFKIGVELVDENPSFIGMRHGHISTYTNGRCRHVLCKYANTVCTRIRRQYGQDVWTKVDRCLEAIIEAHHLGMPRGRKDKVG